MSFARSLDRSLSQLGVRALDDVVIFGSSVMKLHGLKDSIGDVDLFVAPRAYARLRSTDQWWEQRPAEYDPPFLEAIGGPLPLSPASVRLVAFHAFHAWTSRDPWLDVPDAVATAERVHGLPCVRLELVARWKSQALQWCHDNDVTVIGSPWEKHEHDLRVLYEAGVRP